MNEPIVTGVYVPEADTHEWLLYGRLAQENEAWALLRRRSISPNIPRTNKVTKSRLPAPLDSEVPPPSTGSVVPPPPAGLADAGAIAIAVGPDLSGSGT
jgi:hypothetical protein